MEKVQRFNFQFSISLVLTIAVWSIFARQINGERSLRFPQQSSNLHGLIKDVKNVLLDHKNRRITLAPINYIVQLDMDSLKLLHQVHIPTEEKQLEQCVMRSSKELCQNVFKVLSFDSNGRIFTCGTNGGDPKCWVLERLDLRLLPEFNLTGVGRCPGNPKVNVTSIFQGDYLFSTSLLRANQYYIFKGKASKSAPYIRTHEMTSMLNHPSFVSSYSLGNGFVYLFFREVAIENVERKVVYSRVARVCQYDKGENFVSEDRFTTFLKSQMVCVDRNGLVPTYFDELQSTYLLEVHTKNGPEMFIYGVFTTSSEILGSSAVCRYKVSAIKKLFDSSKYSEKTKDDRWVPVSHPGKYPDIARAKCTKDLDTLSYDFNSAVFAMRHPLLYDDVMPFDDNAILVMPGISLTSLVVKDVHYQENLSDVGIHVIFAGSTGGAIYKVMVNSSNHGKPHTIEVIYPFKEKQPITALKLSEDAVFAGTTTEGVARVPLNRCDQYLLCSDCVKARDPFCAWDGKKSSCVTAFGTDNGHKSQDILTGDVSICPPISGEISCDLQIVESFPGATTILQCSASGFPTPSIIGWTKEDTRLVPDGDRFQVRNISSGKQQLTIRNYTVQDVGKYNCIVARGSARASCDTVLVGSEPVVNCSRAGEQCQCAVTGSPQPKSFRLVDGQLKGLGVPKTVWLSSGVNVIAVNAFGEAGITCFIPTEPPTQPLTTTAASTSTTARTSSSTATPTTTVEAPTTTATTRAPLTPGAVPRKACPGCECVSYRTPLIVVSVLFTILAIFCTGLLIILFSGRVKRYTVDKDKDFSNDSDDADGQCTIVIYGRKGSRKPSAKRTEAKRNESRKSLIRNPSNDSNQVYKPTVVDKNHKQDKGANDNHRHIGKQSY